ncbi:DUF6928 family protein [Streptomyces sp. NPDC002328]|uniref:DUF6928 family protein n=1 Tax=Streptomyces sp. NPDC002328 TaxID=3364642 RepID=UPI0036769E7D
MCVLSRPGLDIICDQALMLERPSQLPEHLVQAGRGRRLYLHATHSVADWLAFAIWEDGRLIRSLSASPDHGITEDTGDRLPFELPYWQGRQKGDPCPPYEDEEPTLPFCPLDLGERALREFFGLDAEDAPPEPTMNPWSVELHGYRPKTGRWRRLRTRLSAHRP